MFATMPPPANSFSVVVPLFDKRRYLRAAIESVLRQTLPPLELIVVDDGSTDGGADTIADLLGDQVRLIRQANAGPGAARNRGCMAARGDWIALLDADDLWRAEHLATLAAVASRFPKADMVATGSLQRYAIDTIDGFPVAAEATPRLVDFFRGEASGLNASSVAIRRSTFLASTGFSEARVGEDTDYWIRLALDHVFAVSDRATSIYRRDTGGIMEREQARLAAGEALPVSPIFATLDAALADPRRASRHAAIRDYADRTALQFARTLVYHGRGREARSYLRRVHRRTRGYWSTLALSHLPSPLLRTAARRYSAAKRTINAHRAGSDR